MNHLSSRICLLMIIGNSHRIELANALLDTHAGAETTYKKIKYRAMNFGTRIVGITPFLSPVAALMFGATTLREQPELVAEWNMDCHS